MNLEEVFNNPITKDTLKETSPLMLAFIGDAVHTLYVRDFVVKDHNLLIKDYHKKASSFCNASFQAKKLELIMTMLSEEELNVVRRARNTKLNHTAKNADVETYKKATCYEALIGYLYLTANYKRLNEILKF